MKRVLTLTLAVALFGILTAVVVAQVGQDQSPSGTTAGTTTAEEGTTTAEDRTTTTEDRPKDDDRGHDDRGRDDRSDDGPGDISGPCDETEHANDPRCTGVTNPQPAAPAQPGVDISGPCDEAEHANDPRCTGAGRVEDRDHGDDDRHEDNSGPGNAEDRVDNSGPGNGEDHDFDQVEDDDHSGSGHGGDDDGGDDNSGHGGGDDD
jgi:hypothetical protein